MICSVRDIARVMVTEFGMSGDRPGQPRGQSPRYICRNASVPERGAYARKPARIIDAEIKRIISTAEATARRAERSAWRLDALSERLRVRKWSGRGTASLPRGHTADVWDRYRAAAKCHLRSPAVHGRPGSKSVAVVRICETPNSIEIRRHRGRTIPQCACGARGLTEVATFAGGLKNDTHRRLQEL